MKYEMKNGDVLTFDEVLKVALYVKEEEVWQKNGIKTKRTYKIFMTDSRYFLISKSDFEKAINRNVKEEFSPELEEEKLEKLRVKLLQDLSPKKKKEYSKWFSENYKEVEYRNISLRQMVNKLRTLTYALSKKELGICKADNCYEDGEFEGLCMICNHNKRVRARRG